MSATIGVADALQPRIENVEVAKHLDDGVWLLRDQRLKLRNMGLVVALGIQRNRFAAKCLHLVNDALIGHQVPVVIRADCRNADALASQRELLIAGILRKRRVTPRGNADGDSQHGSCRLEEIATTFVLFQ
jgi:hypothetical protein